MLIGQKSSWCDYFHCDWPPSRVLLQLSSMQSSIGSGPRYQILSHVFARCATASQKTYGHARITRDSRMAVGFLTRDSRMAVGFLTRAKCKKAWHKSYTSESGHCLVIHTAVKQQCNTHFKSVSHQVERRAKYPQSCMACQGWNLGSGNSATILEHLLLFVHSFLIYDVWWQQFSRSIWCHHYFRYVIQWESVDLIIK